MKKKKWFKQKANN